MNNSDRNTLQNHDEGDIDVNRDVYVNGGGQCVDLEERVVDDEEGDNGSDDMKPSVKVVMAGSVKCGKTCLLNCFDSTRAMDDEVYRPTVGADFRIAEIHTRDRVLSLQIWDSSGDLKVLNACKSIYKNADCLVLVYDITDSESFYSLELYWNIFLKNAQPTDSDEFPALLVGSKSDLSGKRAVPLETVMEWCAKRRSRKPITYTECSAKQNMCVRDVFLLAADVVYDYALCIDDEEDDEDEGDSSFYSDDRDTESSEEEGREDKQVAPPKGMFRTPADNLAEIRYVRNFPEKNAYGVHIDKTLRQEEVCSINSILKMLIPL